MSWNYRVVHVIPDDKAIAETYSVREVYYHDDRGYRGDCPASVADWESLNDLAGTLSKMCEALALPVLRETTDGLQEESHTSVATNNDVAPRGQNTGYAEESELQSLRRQLEATRLSAEVNGRGFDAARVMLQVSAITTKRLKAAALAVYAAYGLGETLPGSLLRELGDAADACGPSL